MRNPREENGEDGYPRNNPAFRRAAKKVLKRRAADLKKAEAFLRELGATKK